MALLLVEQGKKVTIVECLPTLSQDIKGFPAWGDILHEIKSCEGAAEVFTSMYVKGINDDGLICEPPGGRYSHTFDISSLVTADAETMIKCDTIVVGWVGSL